MGLGTGMRENAGNLGIVVDLWLTPDGKDASKMQPTREGTLLCRIWTRKIRDRRSLKSMMQKRRTIVLAALSFAVILIPVHRLKSQEPSSQSVNPSAAPAQAQPSSQDPDFDPRKRERSDKDRFAARGLEAGVEGGLQDLAEPGRSVDYYGRGSQVVQEPFERRGAGRVYRAVLASAESES